MNDTAHKRLESDGIDRTELPDVTRHRESPQQGGEVYFRCEGCGRESVYGGNEILHGEGCPRRARGG
jgi:hypothetical protein